MVKELKIPKKSELISSGNQSIRCVERKRRRVPTRWCSLSTVFLFLKRYLMSSQREISDHE